MRPRRSRAKAFPSREIVVPQQLRLASTLQAARPSRELIQILRNNKKPRVSPGAFVLASVRGSAEAQQTQRQLVGAVRHRQRARGELLPGLQREQQRAVFGRVAFDQIIGARLQRPSTC
jgi:hypothetical protein